MQQEWRSSGFDSSLLVNFLGNLCRGLLGCLGIVVTSVGAAHENSQGHDRDNYAATYVNRSQMFHAEDPNGLFRHLARHLIRGSDLGQRRVTR